MISTKGRRRGERGGERGSVVLELPLVFGLLLVPFGMLVISAPVWVERQTAARDAAAEAARHLVLDAGSDGRSADQIVREIEAGYGLAPGTLWLELPEGVVGPGETLSVRVTVEIPAVSLPIFGGIGAVDWTAEHSERSPDYGASQ